MGNNHHTFEVRVEVRQNGSKHFSYHVGMYIENKIVKMFHKDARTDEQAMRKCEKYGRPISARKVDAERIKQIDTDSLLQDIHRLRSPYPNAVAMDEFVWRKNKRAERIESNTAKKDGY